VRNLLITAVAMLAPGTAHAETYAIQAGRLIVDAAKPALGPSTLIVTDCRITAIQPGDTAPAGATVVDQRSRTVLPGMTDVHVHLTMNSGEAWYMRFTQKYSVPYATTLGLTHALEMARAGFTTVRDLNGDTSAVIALRDAIDEGRFPGPRIKVSGAALSMIGGHGDRATGPAARTGDGDRHRAPQ
jgi:imidazolonepropionase-like amidohydrolase